MCHTCKELVLLFSQIRRMRANPHTCEKWYKILIHVKNLLIPTGMERITKYSSHLLPGFYCASCKGIMTPVAATSSSVASHFLFAIENS